MYTCTFVSVFKAFHYTDLIWVPRFIESCIQWYLMDINVLQYIECTILFFWILPPVNCVNDIFSKEKKILNRLWQVPALIFTFQFNWYVLPFINATKAFICKTNCLKPEALPRSVRHCESLSAGPSFGFRLSTAWLRHSIAAIGFSTYSVKNFHVLRHELTWMSRTISMLQK